MVLYGRPDISGEDNLKLIVSTDETRRAIINAGGIPIVIMPTQDMIYHLKLEKPLTDLDKEILDTQIALCDGIVMPGGYRIYFYDKYICQKANEIDIPLFGICMGMQLMCSYNNDNKNIKVDGHRNDSDFMHEVKIAKRSKLYSIIKQDTIKTNSFHTYAVSNSGDYKVAAKSGNVIEAVEMKDSLFNIGVQWHPEKCNDDPSKKLFSTFISAAKKYHYNK